MDENLPPSSPALPTSPPQALSQSPPWGFLGQSDTSADCTSLQAGEKEPGTGKGSQSGPFGKNTDTCLSPRGGGWEKAGEEAGGSADG